MQSFWFRGLTAVALAFAMLGTAPAQENKGNAPKPTVRLTVAVGSTVRVRMTTKRPIKTVFNENEFVLRVSPVPDDPTTVLVTGLRPGMTRIYLTDIDGKKEVLGPKK
jgi:Tol biopolymer transport system component